MEHELDNLHTYHDWEVVDRYAFLLNIYYYVKADSEIQSEHHDL